MTGSDSRGGPVRVGEGPSFHGSPRPGGRNEARITAIVVVLVIAFVGIAIAKPWAVPAQPAPSGGIPRALATPPAAAFRSAAPAAPSAAPPVTVGPLPVAFTTALSSGPATWAALDWRRLAADDPLTLVRSVLPWRRGFVAVGLVPGLPSTPVWTSADGTHWDVLPFNTGSTFWPGSAVLRVAELQSGLVALTETVEYCGEPCTLTFELPVVSWTSPNGRDWTPHLLPPEWLARPSGAPPLTAVGPSGLIVASTGPGARLATSSDGALWHLLPADGFPARFSLNDLHGTSTGYVAAGRWMPAAGRGEAAALWSSDGRHWSETPTILPAPAGAEPGVASTAAALVVGRDGMVAVGRGVATPGPAAWWRSPDGRHWAALPAFPPLGPTTCTGAGCGSQPAGTLVGDGSRLVALRGGADAGAWTSLDGRGWQRLRVTGDIPGEGATVAVLLPGGVLLTDGVTTWLGEAQPP